MDSLEDITHSLCTLEFESRRASYYWLLEVSEGFETLCAARAAMPSAAQQKPRALRRLRTLC